MTILSAILDIPKNPAERRAWIIYRLRVNGWSLRMLAEELGCSHQAVVNTVAGRPNSHIEPVIAERIGVSARELFSEHYTPDGRRIARVRPQTRNRKASRLPSGSNIESGRAA